MARFYHLFVWFPIRVYIWKHPRAIALGRLNLYAGFTLGISSQLSRTSVGTCPKIFIWNCSHLVYACTEKVPLFIRGSFEKMLPSHARYGSTGAILRPHMRTREYPSCGIRMLNFHMWVGTLGGSTLAW
jgi:hypothetical protein